MRTMTTGEVPRIGSKIRVVHEGTVTGTEKTYNGKTRVKITPGIDNLHSYTPWTFIIEGLDNRKPPEFTELEPPPRTFRTGVMYYSTLPQRQDWPEQKYWLRTEDGWQQLGGHLYPDGDEYRCLLSFVVDSLVELVPVKEEK